MEATESTVILQEETTKPERKRKKGRHGLGHIYRHRASWYLDARIKGVRHRIRLGSERLFEKREARQLADAKIKELLTPKPESAPVKGTMPFSEFAAKFLGRAADSKRSWARLRGKPLNQTPLKHAVQFFCQRPLKDITSDQVDEFRSSLLNRPQRRRLKPASANRYVSLLRHVFNCAIRWGDAASNPVAGIKMLYEEPKPERYLREGEEQQKFLAACPRWLMLIILFALNTGMRRGEIVSLTWKQVDFDGGWIKLYATKSGKARAIPINQDVKTLLEFMANGNPDDLVFEPQQKNRVRLGEHISKAFDAAVLKAKVEKLTFHDLRHTALSRMVAHGTDINTVREIAGHTSIKTTQRYLHTSEEQKRKAMEKLESRGEIWHYIPTTDGATVVETKASRRVH